MNYHYINQPVQVQIVHKQQPAPRPRPRPCPVQECFYDDGGNPIPSPTPTPNPVNPGDILSAPRVIKSSNLTRLILRTVFGVVLFFGCEFDHSGCQ